MVLDSMGIKTSSGGEITTEYLPQKYGDYGKWNAYAFAYNLNKSDSDYGTSESNVLAATKNAIDENKAVIVHYATIKMERRQMQHILRLYMDITIVVQQERIFWLWIRSTKRR